MTHEQSHVPFGGFADSRTRRCRVSASTWRQKQIIEMDVVLPASAGFIRFCSAFMAGPARGLRRLHLLRQRRVERLGPVPAGAPYRADPAIRPYRQAGLQRLLNTATGDYGERPGRPGRHNHENQVIVPGGWAGIVALSGDDTFTRPRASPALSCCTSGERSDARPQGRRSAVGVPGHRRQRVAVDPADAFNDANDYLDIAARRRFHRPVHPGPRCDRARARRDLPPQDALEQWSNENNVFQFVRVEDIAYDPDDPRTVYFADTGTTRLSEDPATGRLYPR